jgi:hemerythrin
MKNLVEWSEELSVGIEEIDEQHKIIVGLVNRLYEGIIHQSDAALIQSILDELVQYTIVHFAVEESLMRIFDYPHYDEHKHAHQELTKHVMDLQKKFRLGKVSINMELLSFLRKWVTTHILGDDKKYTPYFLEKGLKTSWNKRTSWMGKIWQSVHH